LPRQLIVAGPKTVEVLYRKRYLARRHVTAERERNLESAPFLGACRGGESQRRGGDHRSECRGADPTCQGTRGQRPSGISLPNWTLGPAVATRPALYTA
jgi:hypothetical protein